MNTFQIQIKNKVFPGKLLVLENIKIKITSGEFVAVVGPSGAGKTTLLNIIAGIDDDYQGSVSMPSEEKLDDAQIKIGFMFQQASLMPWLTVLENIALVINQSVKAKRQEPELCKTMDKANQMIKQVGLTGFEKRYPRQLSGGMQKRVALARAFAIDPQLLLLDEPFQSLDSPTANKFRDQLMSLWNSQKQTVLFVTHDLREAISMADRILFMSDRPSHVLLDFEVDLSRPRSIDSKAVSELHQSILTRYPELLSGVL